MEAKETKNPVNPNLEIYEAGRSVPEHALRKIEDGPLKGKSDVNPMFRIQKLTELFGPCGFGWYTEICRKWTETLNNETTAVFVDINLFVKRDGEWSKPIHGTGGNKLVNLRTSWENGMEKLIPRIDDEAYKKAYTDALSSACKALGIAADVYWEADVTKYSDPTKEGHGWGLGEGTKPAGTVQSHSDKETVTLAAAPSPGPAERKRSVRKSAEKTEQQAQPESVPQPAVKVNEQPSEPVQAPAAPQAPEVKLSPFGDPEMPVLREGSRAWAPSVTRIIRMQDVSTEEIKKRIRAKYYITDDDFSKLMKTAGRTV